MNEEKKKLALKYMNEGWSFHYSLGLAKIHPVNKNLKDLLKDPDFKEKYDEMMRRKRMKSMLQVWE